MQVVSCKKKKRRRKQIEAIWSEPTHFVTEVLLLRIWASKETEVRGQWLEGKTKNQLQVVSRKLQVKKPSKTSLGSREIKANRFSAWWFSVRRGEPWSNSIKIPTRSFVGMTESILFALIVSCHPAEPALISLPQSARVWGLLFRVIPNLFRDLGFGETVVGGQRLGVGKSDWKPDHHWMVLRSPNKKPVLSSWSKWKNERFWIKFRWRNPWRRTKNLNAKRRNEEPFFDDFLFLGLQLGTVNS